MQDRRRRPRRRRVWLWVLLVAIALLLWCRREAPLVLGTFNIQTFPGEETDPEAVAAAIAELDADAFAVQEIRDPGKFYATLDRASALAGRRYAAVLTDSCRHNSKGRLSVGVVYDTARLELKTHRSLSKGEVCPTGQAPALLASLQTSAGRTLTLVSVHFDSGGAERRFERRKQQWQWLTSILPALREEFGDVVVAGDFNTTGYLVENHSERRFIDEMVERHALQLPTGALGCSEYWQPKKAVARWEASLLDHFLGSKELSFGTPEVLGMCAALGCEVQTSEPPKLRSVSDHCPVRVELRD
ncbi:endonuclease/exonuclease/phosphatase family protein [Nannocystis sp. ILAH1]|uniref:endonuclease/exonuclease/phosphatase family protein n=1 Tax=unclassified Nannocystis TaxID=2627009 RepID=UPI00227038E6|nr:MULTISPECIES: endonuclease/exonuclease/phosphatase family protein [unclassified Nannocystis]MCY0991558.1 endonuclease/exonuclease/phosphatase family protein [Nannocystis sp. ILAH1]MCY1066606.1 endonuclease/exonuclease/phosphatase family protein [Nannocystis sp. RBIL2]